MVHVQVTPTAMELLPLLCLCVLTRAGTTFADQHDPDPESFMLKDRRGEKPGAAPLPYVTILGETKDGVQLQCVVQGASPKPKVRWQDGAGNILPAKEPLVSEGGGRYDIILQTTVTKADHYQCVATQEEINHQINATIYVPVTGAAPAPSIKILGETQDGVQLLQCVVRGASPKPKVQWQDGAGNILPAKEPQVSERGDVTLQTTVTKTDHYRCVATQEEINHQIHTEIFVLMNSAVSKPSIMILGEREDRVQLQCEVHGASPKPKVQWQDGAGNILPAKEPQVSERGGSFDIILQTTVTKTDHYRCVATQEEINHQIYAETYVPVHGFPIGWIAITFVGTLLPVGALLAVLIAKGCIDCSQGGAQTRVPHEDPNHLV